MAKQAKKPAQDEQENNTEVQDYTPIVAEGFDIEAYKADVQARGKVFAVLSDGSLIEK